MSRRHLSSARSNRKLVIESTTRSSEASNSTDRLSGGSGGNRRRGGVRRENSSPRQDYAPNGKIFGGGNVSHRSRRLLVKAQNETGSSAFRLSEPGTSLSTKKPPQSKQRGRVEQEDCDSDLPPRPMSYSGHSSYGIHPGSQVPSYQYPPAQYPPSQVVPGVMYAHQGSYFQQPSTDNSYESYLSRQYQINEMQRQEEVRRAEHKQRLAQTEFLQQQQRELELKNAAMALEMEQEEIRRREREEQLRNEQERKREQEEREREQEMDRQLQQLQDPSLDENLNPPPLEAQMSNEQLLNELAILKKAISASNSLNSTDDELLVMFSKLQVLQDILEKRNVEIDAAQLLARTFRRQSSQDMVPGQQLRRRRSSLEEKPPPRNSYSRQGSLDNRSMASRGSVESRPTQSRRSSIDNKKSITRQSSGSMTSTSVLGLDESRPTSFSRQTSIGEQSDDGTAYRESLDSIYGGGGDEEDVVEVETDPRVIRLQHQISLLSSRILSKSFTDKTLLAMFDQLDDLKRELAMLKGIDLPFDGVDEKSMGSSDWSKVEAAELQINPQFREIKKLKPVLRRLLPARTQFAKIEELFHCDIDTTSDEHDQLASAKFSLDMIGEEDDEIPEEDNYGDVNDYSTSTWHTQGNLEAVGEEGSDEEDYDEDHGQLTPSTSRPDSISEEILSPRQSMKARLSEARRSMSDIAEVNNVSPRQSMTARLSEARRSSVSDITEASILSPRQSMKARLSEARRSMSDIAEVNNVSPRQSMTARLSEARRSSVSDVAELNSLSPQMSKARRNLSDIAEVINVSPRQSMTKRLSEARRSNVSDVAELNSLSPRQSMTARMSEARHSSVSDVAEVKKQPPPPPISWSKPIDAVAKQLQHPMKSTKTLSMERRDGTVKKRRSGSGFLMGNPMSSPRPKLEEGERESSSSMNSMDRLPQGVDAFRKPKLDIFQSTRR